MNLYLISRPDQAGYDEYDSAVVAANSEEEARMIHPGGYDWDGTMETFSSWVAAEDVIVELIGTATPETKAGVICASFNAG